MTRKRVFLLTILVLVCLAIVLYVCIGKTNYKSVIDEAKLVAYENADEVIDDSVLIVRVKKISETAKEYPLENGIVDRFTLSTVKIIEVYKNTHDAEIVEGSKIEILESQWTDEENKTVHHTAGYLKMKTGNEYLLCLGYNPSVDNYYPTGLLCGKIPVDSREQLFLASGYEQINEMVQDLRNKYIK